MNRGPVLLKTFIYSNFWIFIISKTQNAGSFTFAENLCKLSYRYNKDDINYLQFAYDLYILCKYGKTIAIFIKFSCQFSCAKIHDIYKR